MFDRKGVLKNFANFTGKHLCQSLFFNKELKKRLWHRCFPVKFAKILRTPFLQRYLLKQGTTWNHLKPAETTQKLPKTTRNHLKPVILYYFLLKISYSQDEFVLIPCPKVLFGQFGLKNCSSPNWLKFGTGYITISSFRI